MSADYFRNLLNVERDRLTALCIKWQVFLADDAISKQCPDDAVGEIMRTVGLTKLLIESKLPQFERLIDNLSNGKYGERTMTSADLQGFWDLVNIEISDVDKKFLTLNSLKSNNWVSEKSIFRPRKISTDNNKNKPDVKKANFDHLQTAAKSRLALAKAKMQETLRKQHQEFVGDGDCPYTSPVKDTDINRVTIC